MIYLKKISKNYISGKITVPALNDISLKIHKNEFVAIMGHSGSGKSTLLNILGALDTPDKGNYLLNSMCVETYSDNQLAIIRRNHIGFVFQNFNLIPKLTVFENVELPLIYGNVSINERNIRVKECLHAVGLMEKLFNWPNELSGGERQRVAIARALINKPHVIIADEPTGNLDVKTGNEIMLLLQALNKTGVTIILVTHEPEIAAYAEKIIKLQDGKIIENSNSASYATSKEDRKTCFPILSQSHTNINLKETIKLSLVSLLSNKLRSGLMLLGIIIAVAAVIISVAVGEAGRKKINTEIKTLGANTIWVYRDWSERLKKEENFFNSVNEINNQDIKYLINQNNLITYLTPKLYSSGEAKYKNKTAEIDIIGTTDTYLFTSNEHLESGRFILKKDLMQNHRVCILSWKAWKQLCQKAKAVGDFLSIRDDKYKIIGILKKKDTSFLEMIGSIKAGKSEIFIPLTVLQQIYQTNNVHSLEASTTSINKSRQVTDYLKSILTRRHRNRSIFKSETLAQYISTSNKIMGTLSLVLGTIAGISLLVGGLGVMNIMFVSVTERTREIGIRKAIGASFNDIVYQFILESITVSSIGGIIGIFLGFFGIFLIQLLSQIQGLISITAITISFFTSFIVGLIAGIYPAIKAAKLKPADALRYE